MFILFVCFEEGKRRRFSTRGGRDFGAFCLVGLNRWGRGEGFQGRGVGAKVLATTTTILYSSYIT